jgi:transketolase
MPDWILIATGSEIALACKVALKLKEDQGKKIHVVPIKREFCLKKLLKEWQ